MDQFTPEQRRGALKRLYFLGWRRPGLFISQLSLMMLYGVITSMLLLVIHRLTAIFGLSELNNLAEESGITIASDKVNAGINEMWDLAWLVLIATPVAAVIAYSCWYLLKNLLKNVWLNLRNAFIDRLVTLDMGFHSTMAKGDLYVRLVGTWNARKVSWEPFMGNFNNDHLKSLAPSYFCFISTGDSRFQRLQLWSSRLLVSRKRSEKHKNDQRMNATKWQPRWFRQNKWQRHSRHQKHGL